MTSQAVPRSGLGRRGSTGAAVSGRVRPRLRPLFVFTVLAIAAFFIIIFARISLDRSAFELQQIEADLTLEEARHWELRVEIAQLRDPSRVADAASELGLVRPDERVSLVVDGIAAPDVTTEYRWEDLRALLSSQP